MIEVPPALAATLTASDVLAASDSVPAATVTAEPYASRINKLLRMLDDVSRTFRGRGIKLTSVLRSSERNVSVGGSPHSHHVQGWAADFNVIGLESPKDRAAVFDALRSIHHIIPFDELGIYNGHLHISADPRARGKVFDKRTQPEPHREGGADLRVVLAIAAAAAAVLVVVVILRGVSLGSA